MFTSEADQKRADWPLLRDGAINLFWRQDLFESAKADLSDLGYTLIQPRCDDFDLFQQDLGSALRWKALFGYEPWTGNLNALDEGLQEATAAVSPRIALCFSGFHRLAAQDKDGAIGLLEVIEAQSREQLLLGNRLIALVQTNDGQFHTPALAGRAAKWNHQEWLNSTRRPA